MSSKRYLVTGGAGFIGSHVCDFLLARGDHVIAIDNFCSGRPENIGGHGGRLSLLEGDLRALPDFHARIGRVDAVIHLAALISSPDSLKDPREYFDVNVNGLTRVIDFVSEFEVPRIVFASSSTVYGQTKAPSIDETVVPAPMTVYALTKLAGEHLLAIYGPLRNFSHVSLRLFNVYGPRQAEDHPYANVACKFCHAAAHNLAARRYGDGEQTRDFVYIADVVNAVAAVLERSRSVIYNVGTGTESSINTLLTTLADITGERIPVEQCDAWPNDIRRIKADVARLSGEFGTRRAIDLREGLRATLDYFKRQDSR